MSATTPATTPPPGTGTGPLTGAREAGTRADRRPRRGRALGAAGVLMAPFFALLTAVFLVPVGGVLWLSLFQADQPGLGFGPERTVFAGLRGYAAVLTDPTFLTGLGTLALYCLLFLPVLLTGALALALLLDSGAVRLRRTAQLALFLPHAVPGIIAAVIWLYLYTPGLSPVVELLGRADVPIDFLGVRTVLPSVVNIAVWSGLGHNMVIFYAALQAVPREVCEAAVTDGAGPVRVALLVKLPMIRAAVVMAGMFALIASVQLFTEPMLLSQSAPVVNSRWTPTMYVYDAAFNRNNYGLAAAASVVLLAVTMALSYGVARWNTRHTRREAGR